MSYNQSGKSQKQRILKTAGGKWLVSSKWISIRPPVDFSAETLKSKIMCDRTFEVLKRKNCQPIIVCLANYALKMKD